MTDAVAVLHAAHEFGHAVDLLGAIRLHQRRFGRGVGPGLGFEVQHGFFQVDGVLPGKSRRAAVAFIAAAMALHALPRDGGDRTHLGP